MAHGFMISGFVLVVVGIGLWSVPAACIVSGALLFTSGGLAAARKQGSGEGNGASY